MATVPTPRAAKVRAMPPSEEWLGPEPARLSRLLFPSDLSAPSRTAFPHVRFLAERFRARVTLCHLVDTSRHRGPGAAERIAQAADRARRELEGQAAELSVDHDLVVYGTDSPALVLASHVRTARPDLTVMATHGRKGASHLLLGSVTETVLRRSGRPVLCVRESGQGTAGPYRRIVVPTDATESSRRAFPLATLLARAFDAEVLVVHTGLRSREGPEDGDVYAAVHADLPAVRLAVCVPHGPPESAVLEVARHERADLIVMPQCDHRSLREAIGGTVTERVVREAPCPVLVV